MPDLAFVLLRGTARPDPARIEAHAADLGIPLVRTADDPLGYTLQNDARFLVMHVAAPHPDAAGMPPGPLSATPEEIRAHGSHLIVTALGLEGESPERDLEMAALTACAMAGGEALGAMLGHGVSFKKAALFRQLVDAAVERGQLPAELVVDLTAARESGDRMSFLTHGLRRYGREEFLVTCPISGRGAVDFVLSLARWMLMDPEKHLPTGDTVGRTPQEKVRIQRTKSPTGSGETVIRLDLP
jgi:hypothetical protein